MDKSHNADGDVGGLGGDPAPHCCVVGGNVVGNGSCHGPLPGTEPPPASASKGAEGVACDDGAWTTPVVAAETCGFLKENWHEGGEELARGQSCLGGLSDARRRKMMKACDSLPRPLRTAVPEPGENEMDGVKDGLEPANQCLEDSGGREEAPGVGLEGDGVAGSREQGGGHGAEEELGEDQGERSEARQEVEENVEWQRCVGGRKSRVRSAAEQCQQQVPAPASFRPFASSGGRHKQARRRRHHHHHHNHHHQGKVRGHLGTRAMIACREFLSESLRPWCLSCFRMIVELIVLMARQCGEFVEAGGKALYDSGSLFLSKAKDLPAVRSEARRLLGKAGTAGAVLLMWGLSLAKSGWQRGASCVCVVYRVLLLLCGLTLGLVCRLGGERGRRWWTALLNSGVWKCTMVLLQTVQQKMQCLFKRNDLQVPQFNSEAGKGPGRCHPGKELERLLDLAHIPEDELDPFVVLGVEDNATDPELKRAYRQLAVQVHPDKNKHPRAGEAFKVLRAAWDIVSNPETYRQYQLKRMAESELSRSMNEFLTKLQDDLKEAMNTMMCTKCEGKHKRFEMERDPEEARFCAECNKHHSAEEGDFWAESSMLGLRITYFSFMDGKVYDITEWAGCQRISITPDTHRVPYHISFRAKSGSGTARHRAPADQHPGPNSPADLQDFFNRIFQGRPPGGVAANGSFFPPGGGPPPAPSSHPGFFPSGGPRGDAGESRTESSRPVRRRKKVRKPFQW